MIQTPLTPWAPWAPWAACASAAVVVLLAAGLSPAAAQQRPQKKQATLVAVDAVLSQPLSQTVPVIGRLVARRSGVVAARTGGAVDAVRVDVGEGVKKGQVVATLVKDVLQGERNLRAAEAGQAQAAVKTAGARIDLLRQALKRPRTPARLRRLQPGPPGRQAPGSGDGESLAGEAAAALKRARANLHLAEINLYNADIRSPYAGVITRRHTESGAFVKAGDPVVMLIDDTTLEIEADVPAKRIGGLSPGTEVAYRFTTGPEMSATVRAVVPEENPLTRTRTVRFSADFNNGVSNLAASQSVTLLLPAGARRTVVTVHKDAVLNRKGRTIVFVVEDGVARLRPVALAEAVGSRFEVVRGLKPGDLVVVRGNERLAPEQKVRHGGS